MADRGGMDTRKRFGVVGLAAALLLVLEYLQSASFMHKLLEDVSLTGLLAWLLPAWLGPFITVFMLLFLALWAFEPHVRSSGALETALDTWLARRRLRMTTFVVAKRMREFAEAALADYSSGKVQRTQDNFLKRFFDRFPFESYQRLEDRMKAQVYGGVRPHVSAFMPSSPEEAKKIADCLEDQALKIPEDMLL